MVCRTFFIFVRKVIYLKKITADFAVSTMLLTEEIKRKYGKRIKKNPFRNNRVIRICG